MRHVGAGPSAPTVGGAAARPRRVPARKVVPGVSDTHNWPMVLYLIEYTYDPRLNSLIRDSRPAHRTFLRGLHEKGALVASGFLRDDTMNEGALIVLRASSAKEALALVDDDPFNQAGFNTNRRVREWTPTIGEHAEDFDTQFPIS